MHRLENFLSLCLGTSVRAKTMRLIGKSEETESGWLVRLRGGKVEKPSDQYSGKQYEITTEGFHGSRGVARVKTYGEVLREYEFHSSTKSADPKGKPSGKQTIGLLRRRHVRVDRIIYIGKESNRLEEIEAGIVHSPESVYTEYPDPRRDEWESKTLPALKKLPVSALMKLTSKSRSMLFRARAGRSKPRKKNQMLLASILRKTGMF